MSFGPIPTPQTTDAQEAAQNEALGNATAENPALARNDPLVDATVKSLGATEGVDAQYASLEGNLQMSDPVTGNASQVDPNDGLIFNALQLTPAQLATVLQRTIIKAVTGDLTVAEVTNTLISNYGQGAACTLTLPAAAANMGFTVGLFTTGNAFHVKAGPNDKIYLDGTALDDGDKVSCTTPVAGNVAAFFTWPTGDGVYDWYCTILSGFWSDGGA